MSERLITVRGTGRASAAPDEIHLLLVLDARHAQYEEAMSLAAAQQEGVRRALASCCVADDALKTTAFHVTTEYESEPDERGSYVSRFCGYRCAHELRISLPMDMARLSAVLAALSASGSAPAVTIRFTVRDADALKDEVLSCAARNARRKAELLAQASGVRLGALCAIEHTWSDDAVYAPTDVARTLKHAPRAANLVFTPDDVTLSDTVTFTWYIE